MKNNISKSYAKITFDDLVKNIQHFVNLKCIQIEDVSVHMCVN